MEANANYGLNGADFEDSLAFFKDIGWKVTEMHGKTYDSYVIEKNK